MTALLKAEPNRSFTATSAATPRKSVLQDANQTQLAIELIGLGARLQVLEAETTLSRDRLIRLYKELRGVSPPKGMLPFSTDWFTTWLPNIHSSLFFSAYQFMVQEGETVAECGRKMDATVQGCSDELKRLGIGDDDLYVDFVAQNKIYGFELSGDVAREKHAGFELKKNISIRYQDPSLLDKITLAAARS